MKDREFLIWIHSRLQNVHGENPDVDYMHRLRAVIVAMPIERETTTTVSGAPACADCNGSGWCKAGLPPEIFTFCGCFAGHIAAGRV